MVKTRSDGEPDEEVSLEALKLKLELKKAEMEQLEKEEEIRKNSAARREREAELEREKTEREANLRREERAHELTMAQMNVPGRQERGAERSERSRTETINIPRIEDRCDPEAILEAFERMCRLYQIPKTEWVTKVLPNLHGKALRAYSKMPDTEANNYDQVKKEILKAFMLTPEEHRRKFREISKKGDESYAQMVNRMKDSLESWIKGEGVEDSFDKLKDLILQEQFIEIIPRDMKVWLLDRAPEGPEQGAELADRFVAARTEEKSKMSYGGKAEVATQGAYGREGRPHMEGPREREKRVTCFKCGAKGHYSTECNRRPDGTRPKQLYFIAMVGHQRAREYDRKETVNGKVVKAYRDTGAGISLVQRRLVERNQFTGKKISLATIAGEEKEVATAIVRLRMDGRDEYVEVAVMEDLPVGFLLGNDIGEILRPQIERNDGPEGDAKQTIGSRPENRYKQGVVIEGKYMRALRDTGSDLTIIRSDQLDHYVGRHQRRRAVHSVTGKPTKLPMVDITVEDMNGVHRTTALVSDLIPYPAIIGNDIGTRMVPIPRCYFVTRQMARTQEENREEEKERTKRKTENEDDPGRREAQRETEAERGTETRSTRSRKVKIEDQREVETEDNQARKNTGTTEEVWKTLESVTGKETFRRLQIKDKSLDSIRDKVGEREGEEGDAVFVIIKDLLHREWISKKRQEKVIQLIVPESLRKPIMSMAHDTRLARHLGVKKSRERVLMHFYWPGIFADVKEYVDGCQACQRMRRPGSGLKAPLQPIPPYQSPFGERNQ